MTKYKDGHAGASRRGFLQVAAGAASLGVVTKILGGSALAAGGLVAVDFGQSLYNKVSKAIGRDWKGGGHVSTGLGTGVIDFVLSPTFEEKGPPDLVKKAKEI